MHIGHARTLPTENATNKYADLPAGIWKMLI